MTKKLTAFQHSLLNGIDGNILKSGLPLTWRAHLKPASRRALDTLIDRKLIAAEGDNYVTTAAGKQALAQHAGR